MTRYAYGLVALAILGCLSAELRALEVTIVTLEGEELPDKLTGVTETGLKFERHSTLATKDISEVRLSGGEAAASSPALYLRNGDVLKATIVSGDDAAFKVKSLTLGEVAVDNKYLHAIVFPLKDGPHADLLESFLKSAPPREDQLLLAKGETLSGFMEKFGEKEMGFNTGGQSRTYTFEQIAAFRLAPLDDYKAPADFRATLVLRDSSTLTGKLLSLQERQLGIEAINGKEWKIATDALQSIQFKGGKLVYLSDLRPQSVEEKPYVGGMPFIYSWQKDKAVTSDKMSIGNKHYPRGIGVHSYCKLTYDLGGEYAKFLCDVGLDGAAPPNAVCAWKVIVDGQELAAGNAKAGDKPQQIKTELKAAKQLVVICDFGNDDDAGDFLNWANARLIKP